jgi:hypothetical protein
MPDERLQAVCEMGQQLLMETRYIEAACVLAQAEQQAWSTRDFDTLARLYLPLQESRRQIRQRCGEGAVQLHRFANAPTEIHHPEQIVATCPNGQLLIGGWGSIEPAIQVRRLAMDRLLYLETFLGAVYPLTDSDPVVVVAPWEGTCLPSPQPRTLGELRDLTEVSEHCVILTLLQIPADSPRGTAQTFASVMAIWERLHQPLMATAACEANDLKRMQAYRTVLRADGACELAHQFLADIARKLARGVRSVVA